MTRHPLFSEGNRPMKVAIELGFARVGTTPEHDIPPREAGVDHVWLPATAPLPLRTHGDDLVRAEGADRFPAGYANDAGGLTWRR